MSTYKPKGSTIFQYDFQWKGTRFHGSTGQKTKRAADRVEARIRAEAALDTGQRRKPLITLNQLAARYQDKLEAEKKWRNDAERIIDALLQTLGPNRYVSEIEEHELLTIAAERAKAVAPSTVNREINVWRALWRFGMRPFDIGEMPDWGAMMYTVRNHDPREMTFDEEARFFLALRADYQPFFRFLLLSGWRISEVRTLRWSDCNLPLKQATTTVKGGRKVRRPLTAEMVKLIGTQPEVGPFVFTYVCKKSRAKRKAGERYPFSQYGFRKGWVAALAAAGIEDFRPHDMRHTRGTRIVRVTGNLALAQGALDHRNIQTTMRYVHATDQDVRAGLEVSDSRNSPEVPKSKRQKR